MTQGVGEEHKAPHDRLGDKVLSDLAGLSGSHAEFAIVGEYGFALFAQTEVFAGKSPAPVAAFTFERRRDLDTPFISCHIE